MQSLLLFVFVLSSVRGQNNDILLQERARLDTKILVDLISKNASVNNLRADLRQMVFTVYGVLKFLGENAMSGASKSIVSHNESIILNDKCNIALQLQLLNSSIKTCTNKTVVVTKISNANCETCLKSLEKCESLSTITTTTTNHREDDLLIQFKDKMSKMLGGRRYDGNFIVPSSIPVTSESPHQPSNRPTEKCNHDVIHRLAEILNIDTKILERMLYYSVGAMSTSVFVGGVVTYKRKNGAIPIKKLDDSPKLAELFTEAIVDRYSMPHLPKAI